MFTTFSFSRNSPEWWRTASFWIDDGRMKAAALVSVFVLMAAGCAEPATQTAATPKKVDAVKEPPRVRSGELVTYKNGAPIGRDKWQDDGDRLVSEVSLAGSTATVTVARKARHVTIVVDGKTL